MKIAFRLDCGAAIGSGHLIRCGALAEEFAAQGCEVLFVCRNKVTVPVAVPVHYLAHAYTDDCAGQYTFPSIEDETEELIEVLKENKISCLIVDHYGATPAYFERLRPHVECLAAIDDLAKYTLPVDVVINGNLYADEQDYETVPVRLCGPSYTLLRRCFRHVGRKEIRERLQDIYITSGGADPLGLCKKLVSACLSWNRRDAVFHIIVGPSFQPEYIEELTDVAAKNPCVKLLYMADMADCMRKADLFITASGSTLYELAACGVPSISVVLAEDQRKVADEMRRLGITYNIGGMENIENGTFLGAFKVFVDPVLRQRMSTSGQNLIDGYGAHRVAAQIIKRMDGCFGA